MFSNFCFRWTRHLFELDQQHGTRDHVHLLHDVSDGAGISKILVVEEALDDHSAGKCYEFFLELLKKCFFSFSSSWSSSTPRNCFSWTADIQDSSGLCCCCTRRYFSRCSRTSTTNVTTSNQSRSKWNKNVPGFTIFRCLFKLYVI